MKSFYKQFNRQVIVSRDDTIYEGFPDLVLLESGKLLCLYRQSDAHAASWSNIALIESEDRGRTWKNRRIISKSRGIAWDLPRLCQLKDGRLVIVADKFNEENFLFWSKDEGKSWSEPEKTNIRGGCPDRIVELEDSSWVVNASQERLGSDARCWRPPLHRQVQYRSMDRGKTWQEDSIIADSPVLTISEGATVELPDGTLICYLRESSGLSHPSPRTYSYD